MRVLIAVGLDKVISGGALQAIQLARELRGRGHTARLVFQPPSDEYAAAAYARVAGEGIPFSVVPMRGRRGLAGARALGEILRRERVEAVYAVKGAALTTALLATLGTEIPIVAHRGVNYPLDFLGRLRYHLPRVRTIVAVSRATRQVIAAASPRLAGKTEVVYQAVAEPCFQPTDPDRLRREFGIPAEAPVVAVVGNFIPRKGHRVFLDCAPPILAAFPATRFVFIGGGNPAPLLEACDPGTARALVCTGFRTDVHELLPGVTVSVNPAIEGEGLTGTTRESMAAGVPVVVTDMAGTRELIDDGISGIVVPCGDRRGLGAAVLRLLQDPVLRASMGNAGRARIEAIASSAGRVAAMEGIFRRAIDGATASGRGEG